MRNIQLCLENLILRLGKISDFLETLDIQKAMIRELEDEKSKKYIKANLDEFRYTINYVNKIKSVIASPVQYNALIISIYGCFEDFVDKIFTEYVNLLCLNVTKYSDLPAKLREKHLKKLGDFLSNPQRYKNFDISSETAISNFYSLLTSQNSICFKENIHFVLSHSGNISMEQLLELMKDMGIEEALKKIINNINFLGYQREILGFTDEIVKRYASSNPQILFSPLAMIVEERNNVAHGWDDSRSNFNGIKEKMIGFIECLAKTLTEIIIDHYFEFQYNQKKVAKFSSAINVIDNHILCINSGNSTLHIGDYILAKKANEFIALKIKRIEINTCAVSEVDKKNIDIGIEFEKRDDRKIKKSFTYYYIMQ